jgi:hypothetical protein
LLGWRSSAAARPGARLRLPNYERTGGLRGSVAGLSQAAYARLDGVERAVARGMLLRLAGAELTA